jgi:deoxycytidine triphosphate deaminase
MTILSAQSIRTNVYIAPFAERTIHSCGMSYGLSASGYDLRVKDRVFLAPMEFALVTTLEEIELPPNIEGVPFTKSTHARQGLMVFHTKFEPNWRGYPTIELINLGRRSIEIKSGEPLCQMEFKWLDEDTEMPYTGKYQNQVQAPVEAIFEKV